MIENRCNNSLWSLTQLIAFRHLGSSLSPYKGFDSSAKSIFRTKTHEFFEECPSRPSRLDRVLTFQILTFYSSAGIYTQKAHIRTI